MAQDKKRKLSEGQPDPSDAPTSDNMDTNVSSVSWPEIFSQHESNLNQHLGICGMVKNHVVPGSDCCRAISSMLERTQELMRQLEQLRSEFMPNNRVNQIISGKCVNRVNQQRAGDNGGSTFQQPSTYAGVPISDVNGMLFSRTTSSSGPPFVFDKTPTPDNIPKHMKHGKKRSLENDDGTTPDEVFSAAANGHNRKRSRTMTFQDSGTHSASAPGQSSTPLVEEEDISAEVEARLNMTEERRRRKTENKANKRKRTSTGSNTEGSVTGHADRPKNKRQRVDEGAKNGDGEAVGKRIATGDPSARRSKRRRK
ncbi:hypothetical protein AJ80_02141 [Polytolypa hystricis UAMH7299]|uniref:Uncharacterized protein n=1 Tax=Polytolypa hystricis (strain UAMH7299) TaxID=1447883 RepID=A0A2B7YRU6_POLH7|nr:hypothetical protein AJ80_02141 [Polytolypa hystricis UAMH7299]